MFSVRFRILPVLVFVLTLVSCQQNNMPTAVNPRPVPMAGSNTVMIGDNFFQPSNLTIPVGTTVTWQQRGSNLHTVTDGMPGDISAGNLFDSGALTSGQSFRVTFSQAGSIAYFCRFHGSMGMTGTITAR